MLPGLDPAAVLPPLTAYYVMRVGDTALVPYYHPGDPAVADAIVVAGDTLEATVFATEELEETAKLFLLLRNLNPRMLSPDQVADLARVFGTKSP